MKTLIVAIALLMGLADVASAQTLDEYCVQMGKSTDSLDQLTAKTVQPNILRLLSPEEQQRIQAFASDMRAHNAAIRHDACFANSVPAARAAVDRDKTKGQKELAEMLAYLNKALANEYRRKQ